MRGETVAGNTECRMSAYRISVLLAIVILVGTSLPGPEGIVQAPMACSQFGATLDNSQEVSPTNPTTSMGAPRPASFGTGNFTFNA